MLYILRRCEESADLLHLDLWHVSRRISSVFVLFFWGFFMPKCKFTAGSSSFIIVRTVGSRGQISICDHVLMRHDWVYNISGGKKTKKRDFLNLKGGDFDLADKSCFKNRTRCPYTVPSGYVQCNVTSPVLQATYTYMCQEVLIPQAQYKNYRSGEGFLSIFILSDPPFEFEQNYPPTS